jgi:ligand-binding sensor domain-containing protein/signal transduction histidine kinase
MRVIPGAGQAQNQQWARVCLLLALWLCLSAVPGLAQALAQGLKQELTQGSTPGSAPRWQALTNPVFDHWDTQRGLPHDGVDALAQDGDGFIWLGTQGGLARWDGYRFKVYPPDPDGKGGLPDNYIHVLHTDPHGRLWIGTNSGGLVRYLAQEERFVRVAGLSHASISALADDGGGGLWVATRGGLDHLFADGHVEQLHHQDHDPASLPHNQVRALLRDRDGVLWVGGPAGLAHLTLEAGRARFVNHPLPSAGAAGTVIVRSLGQSANGRLWIGSQSHGVFVLERATASPYALPADGDNFRKSANLFIREVVPGQVWIGSYGNGVALVDSSTLAVHRVRHQASLPSSLSDNVVAAALRDRSGLVWLGTQYGLSRYNPAQVAWSTVFADAGHISDTNVTAMRSMPDGSVWLGLRGGGVTVVEADASHMHDLPVKHGAAGDDWLLQGVNAITEPYRGSVLLGTDHGLARTDPAGRQLARVHLLGRDSSAGVRVLAPDGAQVWLGGTDGVWRIRFKDADQAVAERLPGAQVLEQQVINRMVVAAGGVLWVATRDAGLFRYEVASQRITHWQPQVGNAQSLSHNNVGHMLFDSRGRLWITTQGGGINLLERPDAGADARFVRIGMAAGLPNPIVDAVLEDRQGKIWASTDAGLVRIDPDTLAVRTLARPDGVAILGYWANSAAQTRHGELLFGGSGGVTVVRPALASWWDYRPEVVISEVQVGGKTVVSGQLNAAEAGAARPRIDVRPGANSVAVEFATLDFSAPQQNRHAYRLDGFDQDWVTLNATQRVATYTNLSPGQYRLYLRGANRNGLWSEPQHSILLLVHPAWYQTVWARLALLVSAVLLVLALVQVRTRYLRRQRLELEHQVSQRTLQLSQQQTQLALANDGLNQSNRALHDANAALHGANQSLALSVETLRHLGDAGRSITAHLDADLVFDSLYRHVGDLLHVSALMIYRMNPEHTLLELVFGREDDAPLAGFSVACDSPTSQVARAARERIDLMLERKDQPDANHDGKPGSNPADSPANNPADNPAGDTGNNSAGNPTANPADDSAASHCGENHIPGTRPMLCAMFCPLIVDGDVLGVMSIQSDRPGAYGERERLIVLTLASYGAIALANATALHALHHAQEQMLQQEKLAALGSLVAGVAHEINTPLGNALVAISGAQNAWQQLGRALGSGTMTRSLLTACCEEGAQFTMLAHSTASRAAQMVTNFQAIAARFEGDNAVLIDLDQYLAELAALVRVPLENDGHRIGIEVEPGLQLKSVPEALSEALGRVLSNVCDHAFGPEMAGCGEVRLTACALRVAGQLRVQICVSDNGRGIAEADLPRVFDPFFSSKSGAGQHIGLGLHVAYNHVTQRLRGKITLNSRPAQGTTVTLLIPQQSAAG